jgi:hypothetical protein
MSDNTDPNIIKRLENQPPYQDEQPKEEPVVEETPEEESPKEEIVEEVEEKEEVVEEKLEEKPDSKKRTQEQFEKLKNSNNKLKEALEVEKKKNILDSLIPETPQPNIPQPTPAATNIIPQAQNYPGLSQKQINESFTSLVDDQGYVDSGLLIETLNDLKERTKQAEDRATKAEQRSEQSVRDFDSFQRNEIMKEVHAKYPKLDPENEEFDERFWKYVRNEVVDQWMNGRPTDVMGAAQEGFDTLYGAEMKKADKIKLEQAETAKKNINALGSSQTSQRETYGDHDTLVRATQKGVKGALAERLRKSGY